MAIHEVAAVDIGAYELTLSEGVIDIVKFAANLSNVEVVSDGSTAIYFTVDGGAPTVKGTNCFYLPAGALCWRKVESKTNQPTVVQLISSGTPKYSVAKAGR